MKKLLFSLCLIFGTVSFGYSQDNEVMELKKDAIRDIYGVIKIKGTEISLIKANVVVRGADFKTQTDAQGGFMIPNVKGDVKISITAKNFIGSEQIIPANTDVIMFSLEPDPVVLGSFKSGGLGDIPMAMLSETGNFIRLDPDKTYSSPSVFSKFNTISGMVVNSDGINIRGAGGLSGKSHPLWVIDGVVYGNTSAKEDILGILDMVGADNIATITVLKGSEGAIYGLKGGDGVVLITTRYYLMSKMLLDAEKEQRRVEAQKKKDAKRMAKLKDTTVLK